MSITATVQNGTIRVPPGLDVPEGTRVEVVVPATPPGTVPRRQRRPNHPAT